MAKEKGEIPISAVIFDRHKIISKASNLVETKKSHFAHAEILALCKATKQLKTNKLNGLNIYVSMEPCIMCSYAISKHHIKNIYFGAYDTKNGSLENGIRIFNSVNKIFKPNIYGGIGEEVFEKLLKDFFSDLRRIN